MPKPWKFATDFLLLKNSISDKVHLYNTKWNNFEAWPVQSPTWVYVEKFWTLSEGLMEITRPLLTVVHSIQNVVQTVPRGRRVLGWCRRPGPLSQEEKGSLDWNSNWKRLSHLQSRRSRNYRNGVLYIKPDFGPLWTSTDTENRKFSIDFEYSLKRF